MSAHLLVGHPKAWAAAMNTETFTYAQIMKATGFSYGKVQKLVRAWRDAGAIKGSRLNGREVVFRIVNPEALLPKQVAGEVRPRNAYDNMWTAMRQMKVFSPTDLVAHAATGDIMVTLDQAAAYCRSMMPHGYLKVVRQAIPGVREPSYRLIRNTGPRPPITKRVTGLFDPNEQAFMHAEIR